MSVQKKKALGRGLNAILESPETDITSKDISGEYVAGAVANIEIRKIEFNPFQPREDFNAESLAELAASIAEQGIIQPITVRKMGYDKYQLISGERRLRASTIAGLITIPAFIRVANDEQMLEWALIENIQRENLNAIEIAISYNRLQEECNLTQEQLSQKVGKNRSTVSNYMRLLKLPAEVQAALRDGRLTMGHARCLVGIEDSDLQIKLARTVIDKDLSVREIEKLVQVNPITKEHKKDDVVIPMSTGMKKLQEHIEQHLNSKVQIKVSSKGKGSVIIPFKSEAELEWLISKLGGKS